MTILSTDLTRAYYYSLYSKILSAKRLSFAEGFRIPCWTWNLSDWVISFRSLWGGAYTICSKISLMSVFRLSNCVSLKLGLLELGIHKYSNRNILSWYYLEEDLFFIKVLMIYVAPSISPCIIISSVIV